MVRKRQIKKTRRKKATEPCRFCTEKTLPNYQDPSVLQNYISDRGKIIARSRTGTCQKHQRRVATAIKQARHLALLPFTPKV